MCSAPYAIAVAFALISSSVSASSSYDAFRRVHRKSEKKPSASYAERLAIFEARKAQVAAHNAQNLSWKLAVNHFADWTPSELRTTFGYKRVGGRWNQSSATASFLQTGGSRAASLDTSMLASVVDWREHMGFANFVHDQGGCGSCWAHAAVGAIEAHADITVGGLRTPLSTQQIIDCTDNPLHCGGTGGCHGATSELAFERARMNGIAFEPQYKGGDGKCPTNMPAALKLQSFIRLPENKASHLMHAVAKKGPVVTSLDANKLHLYSSGVFSGCPQDSVPNHAVLTVGYGNDAASRKKYWLIKNSWSEKWGENGYLRVERHDGDDEYCGVDNKPQEGVYCEGGPASIPVCGMCGCTSDSTYPVVSKFEQVQTEKKVGELGKHFLSKL